MDTQEGNTIPDQIQERWLPVEGFPGYEVSDAGRVRSFWQSNGADPCNKGHIPGGKFIAPTPTRFLKPNVIRGYHGVHLASDGVKTFLKIHRLVLLAFVGPCPPGQECCHGNGDKNDNSLANLSWDTKSKNALDRFKHGGWPRRKGIKNPMVKLTDGQVLHIRKLRSHGHTLKDLGEMFGVSTSTISFIALRRRWKHLP